MTTARLCGFALVLVAVAVASPPAAVSNQRVFHWPAIAPITKTFKLQGLKRAGVAFDIQSPDGRSIYWLGCRGVDFKGSLGDPSHDESDYFGDFDCHLHPITPAGDLNLLVDNAADPAEDFSRMVTNEAWLSGACGNYPEWGRVRHVQLRGMAITFQFIPSRRGTMTFTVHVGPDSSAWSAIAAPPGFEQPRDGACQTVIRTHIPGRVTNAYVREYRLGPPYPSITATQESTTISSDRMVGFAWARTPMLPGSRIFSMPIHDRAGKLAYLFECSAYIGVKGIDRWGMPCGLFAAGGTVNLLVEAVDPVSRMNPAQILPGQLYGVCAAYPQWGANRIFRLRGFQLTLHFTRPEFVQGEFDDHALRSVHFVLKVKPDPEARSAVAQPSKYIYWGISNQANRCETVLVNSELRNAQ